MGLLVAKKYPTRLMLRAADHTYVECGNAGKGWGCWGGKTGGAAFNSGAGSTKRADRIAQPDERAGIACYLVNGVCHQSANRVLLPAGILVSAARGYSLSSAIFGSYGKVGIWPCHAPFNRHSGITGDLPECLGTISAAGPGKIPKLPLKRGEHLHTRAIQQAYDKFDAARATPLEAMRFHVALFDRDVRFRLGKVPAKAGRGLRLAKERVELAHHRMTEDFANEAMSPAEFIKSFNEMTLRFQEDAAGAVNKTQYKKLLGLDRDERLVLADPGIIEKLYGARVVEEVYGPI